MIGEYQLHLYDKSGAKQQVVTDWREMTYTREVNTPGELRVVVRLEHAARSLMRTSLAQVEVWRRIPPFYEGGRWYDGVDWHVDFAGYLRGYEIELLPNGEAELTAIFEEWLGVLAWQDLVVQVGFPANDSVETMMHALIEAALAVPIFNLTLSGLSLSLEADQERWVLGGFGAAGIELGQRNLLQMLQELAVTVYAIGFTLEKVGPTELRFRAWDHPTYEAVTPWFGLKYGNLGSLSFRADPVQEFTTQHLLAYGTGEREVAGGSFSPVPGEVNKFRLVPRPPGAVGQGHTLPLYADRFLGGLPTGEVRWQPLRTPNSLYGQDWRLGQAVMLEIVDEESVGVTIQRVTISVTEQGETIAPASEWRA